MNPLLQVVLLAEEKSPPEANEVVAGWTAFWIFLGMIIAVVLLCWSLVRQLRKVNKAKDAGLYGDTPVDRAGTPADGDAAAGGDDTRS